MSNSRAEERDHARRSRVFTSATLRISWESISVWLCIFCIAIATKLCAQNNDVIDMGGSVMQSPTVFLIFWLPSGFHYDPAGTTATDTQYENLIARFFMDLSAGSYLSIASQYPGTCSPPNIPTQQDCLGLPVTVGRSFIDTSPYIHQGMNGGVTVVTDDDIQKEVNKIINTNNIVPTGLNQEFFVFLGGGVTLCKILPVVIMPIFTIRGSFQYLTQSCQIRFLGRTARAARVEQASNRSIARHSKSRTNS